MNMRQQTLAGQRIGLFGRGGCGKSTLAVFLARALARADYTVCVLDADSTNEGLAKAMGADHAPDSLLEWLGGTVFSGGSVTCPVDDPSPLIGANVKVQELPSRFFSRTADGSLVFQAGKIGPLGLGAGCDGPMAKIARDFAPETESAQPVTVLDFKAGIEDVARGVITSLDWVLGVIDPSHSGIQAAITLHQLLRQMFAGQLPATRHLSSPELVKMSEDAYRHARTRGALFVLNKIPDDQTEQRVEELLADADICPAASIRDDPQLRRAWLEGLPLASASALMEAERIVRKLEAGRGQFPRERPPQPAQSSAP
jgi:CO dehydrogenase maturation factor